MKRCKDPYRPGRLIQQRKYDELFKDIEEGACFRCPDTKTMGTVAQALRQHLKRNGIQGIVRQKANNDDGVCRVWLVKIVRGPQQ